jgi:hypothetical protein
MRTPWAHVGLVVLLAACATPSASPSAGVSSPTPAVPSSAAPAASDPPAASPSSAPAETAWAELTAAGPAAREDHTWTVDAAGEIAYLFGGRDGETVHGDLWAYDLASDAWTELAPPSGPPGRFGHEAAWVEGIGLVVFAGQAGSTFFNDLWAYDPAAGSWSQLPSEGDPPLARYGSCSAIGDDGRLWISHGFTAEGVRFADTRAYDFEAAAWSDETPPAAGPVKRCLHACWLTDAGELALYAGQTDGDPALGDLWVLAAGAWSPVTGALPPERHLPAHARLDGATLVFGGQSLTAPLDDLWLLSDGAADALQVRPAGTGPSPRYGAALIDDPERGRVLLFGGRGEDRAYADTWVLTGLPEG